MDKGGPIPHGFGYGGPLPHGFTIVGLGCNVILTATMVGGWLHRRRRWWPLSLTDPMAVAIFLANPPLPASSAARSQRRLWWVVDCIDHNGLGFNFFWIFFQFLFLQMDNFSTSCAKIPFSWTCVARLPKFLFLHIPGCRQLPSPLVKIDLAAWKNCFL